MKIELQDIAGSLSRQSAKVRRPTFFSPSSQSLQPKSRSSESSVHPVPTALVKAIIRCESDFNPRAFSRAGAIRLMQVMPLSARRVGIAPDELWKPAQNILAGARLPAILLRYCDGVSALVAYNARPRKVFAPLPRNGETPRYGRAGYPAHPPAVVARGRGLWLIAGPC